MKDLQTLEENKEKEVKLERGVITIDGAEVDRNYFFA